MKKQPFYYSKKLKSNILTKCNELLKKFQNISLILKNDWLRIIFVVIQETLLICKT